MVETAAVRVVVLVTAVKGAAMAAPVTVVRAAALVALVTVVKAVVTVALAVTLVVLAVALAKSPTKKLVF